MNGSSSPLSLRISGWLLVATFCLPFVMMVIWPRMTAEKAVAASVLIFFLPTCTSLLIAARRLGHNGMIFGILLPLFGLPGGLLSFSILKFRGTRKDAHAAPRVSCAAQQPDSHWFAVALALDQKHWMWNLNGTLAANDAHRQENLRNVLHSVSATLLLIGVIALIAMFRPATARSEMIEHIARLTIGLGICGVGMSIYLHSLSGAYASALGRRAFTRLQLYLIRRYPGSYVERIDVRATVAELARACREVDDSSNDSQRELSLRVARQCEWALSQHVVTHESLQIAGTNESIDALSERLDSSFRLVMTRICRIRQSLRQADGPDPHDLSMVDQPLLVALAQACWMVAGLALIYLLAGLWWTLLATVGVLLVAGRLWRASGHSKRRITSAVLNQEQIENTLAINETAITNVLRLQLKLHELAETKADSPDAVTKAVVEDLRSVLQDCPSQSSASAAGDQPAPPHRSW